MATTFCPAAFSPTASFHLSPPRGDLDVLFPAASRRPQSQSLVVASFLTLLVACPTLSNCDELEQQFQDAIRPLLANYCIDCHSDDGAEGDLSIESFTSAGQVRAQRETWLAVHNQLRAGSMPPEDGDQPSDQERKQLLAWIDQAVNQVDCSEEVEPGHVTLRRLNRNEYRNTIRDLLGIDYQPAADFPADDVGYGFDNIGDVMSLPTLLMEKYLTAAEQISQQAIATPPAPAATEDRWQRSQGSRRTCCWYCSIAGQQRRSIRRSYSP